MLTIFVGDMVKGKVEALKRAKGYEVVRVGEGGEPYANALSYVGQGGMFAQKVALILDRPLDDVDGKALLFDNTKSLNESDTLVIAIVTKLLADDKKKLKGAIIEEFEIKSKAEMPEVLPFALTDAFGAGDRKRSWVLYRTLIAQGLVAEEIHGALAWFVRSLVLAGKTKSASEAGMKDYPYQKAKSAIARMGLATAERLSGELVQIGASARQTRGGSLEDLLEVFLLKK